jgi:hypothetical protein
MIAHLQAVPKSTLWLTPPEIFNELRRCGIAEFDLDPCHPGRDNPYCVVPARQIYTKSDNGLLLPYHGLVFSNPPFSHPRRAGVKWLKRLIEHGQGIGLCNALTSADWWHEVVVPNFPAIVFPNGKTKFIDPVTGKSGNEPANGIALLGVGEVACEALKRFNDDLGWVVDNEKRVREQRVREQRRTP